MAFEIGELERKVLDRMENLIENVFVLCTDYVEIFLSPNCGKDFLVSVKSSKAVPIISEDFAESGTIT